MWDALPIQRTNQTTTAKRGLLIDPSATYTYSSDVCSARWRDVDPRVQRWALNLWILHFGIRRCPLGPDDIFVWIPYISTLAAKLGRWSSNSASAPSAVVMCNFVDPAHRKRGAAGKMILAIAKLLSSTAMGIPTPLFELQNVPPSMSDATPFLRFSYLWIPSSILQSTSQQEWVETPIHCAGIPGFHPTTWDGYRMFRNSDDSETRRILVDPHDDIVWYDYSLSDLLTANLPVNCKYVRWFSPFGNICVYALNMRFTPPPHTEMVLV